MYVFVTNTNGISTSILYYNDIVYYQHSSAQPESRLDIIYNSLFFI